MATLDHTPWKPFEGKQFGITKKDLELAAMGLNFIRITPSIALTWVRQAPQLAVETNAILLRLFPIEEMK